MILFGLMALLINKRGCNNMDYEYLILNNSDENAIIDECVSCPYKGQCNNQCMQVEAVYNPYINKE